MSPLLLSVLRNRQGILRKPQRLVDQLLDGFRGVADHVELLQGEARRVDLRVAGGAGAEELARTVVRTIETKPSDFHPLYPDDMKLWDKTRTIAQEIYGATDITADKSVRDRFAELEKEGFGKLPICVAKTQYSFSTNPDAKGAPSGFTIPIREVRLSAGAEFVVVICGDIMTMPGLPKVPAANNIELAPDGRITGLF